jgi:peroxiredoxin
MPLMRLTTISLLLMFCCVYTAQPQAAPTADAIQTAADLPPNDPGYIAEDPVLAKLVGQPAPALTLKSIDGKTINLADLYGRRPVYLKVWATYCIPCRVQMPGFRNLYASYGNEMTIVAVNAGVGDDIGKVKQFAQDFDLKMPVAIDDGRLGAWIGMKATPVHLVIGRDGRVLFAGHQDGAELNAALKQALASKAAPTGASITHLAELVTLKIGDVIPPIELQSSNGSFITLPHGPASRPRAIYFSATWCESYMKSTQPDEAAKCKEGRAQVDKLAAEQTTEWFGVMAQMWTAPKALANYESKMQPPFPLALDSTGAAFRTFGVRRLPAVALIDTRGRLVKLVEADPERFATAVSSMLVRK